MIIDIGTGVDESVVKWKYNDKDKWRDADIDELIHLYESVVRCKDCEYKRLYDEGETKYYYCALEDRPNRNWSVDDTDYCSWGERRSDE